MTPGSTATALRAAADALHDAAEHVANLEHAFRLRTGTLESMRERIEVLEGRCNLLEHALSEMEGDDS